FPLSFRSDCPLPVLVARVGRPLIFQSTMSNFIFRILAASAATAAAVEEIAATTDKFETTAAPLITAMVELSAATLNLTQSLGEMKEELDLTRVARNAECTAICDGCIGKIFLTILITLVVWSPIAYLLSYKWIKFREEIEANAAYENIRRRTFELMQQQHGPVQYDSFIGCPVDLFNDRHGPPQIDPSNPPPPTTIASAIQRKISQMVEGTRGGGAPH
ncbi:hypothetical protein PFISCL1PPCAC_28232, partial [Pristionchus fissidentatus]